MSDVLFDDLTSLYNRTLFTLQCCGGIAVIDEHEANATVKRAEMCYHGKLLTINNDLLRNCHKIYGENDGCSPELQHECDGIFFLTQGNNKYFILVELKSKYSQNNIEKAERQLAASYVRVISRLSCLEKFERNEYKACGIIVSHEPGVEVSLKVDRKNKAKIKLNRYEKQMRCFGKKNIPFELNSSFVHLNKLPVRTDLLFDSLPVFHVSSNGSSVKFDLDSILARL